MGEGKRHFGFPNEEPTMMYSQEDFREGCSFNYWMGAGSGVVGTIIVLAGITWVLNFW